MHFTAALRHASLAHHTKDQLRAVITQKKPPTLAGFTGYLMEYKRIHTTVHKPCDFYLEDIERDLCALYNPEMPPFYGTTGYTEYLQTLPKHVQGVHWYIVSCAHASGGSVIADSLGISSHFLQKRDITPIKRAFDQWTSDWTSEEQQECLDEIPEIFVRASKVNGMIYF